MNPLDKIYPDSSGWLKSFAFSPVISLLEFLTLLFEFIKKRLLVPRLQLNPIRTFSSSRYSGLLAEFAANQLEHDGVGYQVSRLIKKGGDFGIGPGILIRISNSKIQHLFIENGEDPRLFIFASDPWIYWQRSNHECSDMDIFITNLRTNKVYELNAPFKINGKNWVPFTFDSGKLGFLYSLDPLVVLRIDDFETSIVDLEVVYPPKIVDNFFWGDEFTCIGKIRGGTPLIRIGDNRHIGFSHLTYYGKFKESHTLGVYIFDEVTNKIQHAEISKFKRRVLIDPYGVSSGETSIIVQTSLSSGNPVRKYVFGYDLFLEYSLESIIKRLSK
jgi:hypothetical protein